MLLLLYLVVLALFVCSHEERNTILSDAKFNNQHLVQGHVKLLWFSMLHTLELNAVLARKVDNMCHSWSDLWNISMDVIRQSERNTLRPHVVPKKSFHENMAVLQNVFSEWSTKVRSVQADSVWSDDSCSLPRKMTALEHTFLSFHVLLRWHRDRHVDPFTMLKYVLTNIKVRNEYGMNDNLLSVGVESGWKFNASYHGMMANLTGTYSNLRDELTTAYKTACDEVFHNAVMVYENLTVPMQSRQTLFKDVPLYTGHVTNRFIENSIASVPLSIFGTSAIREWCESRKTELLGKSAQSCCCLPVSI